MVIDDTITRALNKAKIGLMQKADSAFFTTIVFSLKFQWDTMCPTAYTDGRTLGFNPDFFMSMSPAERIGVLVHEAMHVAYMHMGRLMGREMDIWNQACDHVINLQLLARGFELPSFRLADPRFNDMSAEQVYDILMAEKQQGKQMPQNCMQDLRSPSSDDSLQGQKEFEKHVQDILIRARIQSKMAHDKPGTIPGDIELYLDKLLNPKLPWQTILRKYLRTYNKSDYSWRKPNRRFLPDHYLPSLHGEALMDLVIFVDISGSVSDYQFKMIVSEVASIFRMMKPKKITLIQFDTNIKSVIEIGSIQELRQVKFTGRGGTRIKPVLDWAAEHKPQLSLVFTDGHFRFDRTEHKHDTLWMINDNPCWKAPFGKAVHYSTNN